ncbi:TVP38/TMEM64 family protein [Gilvimarinus sp. 1_MG-2023]|uniref:TVP38/TMEM64 family protein n=1 Tax=Gilvimarinus sp. 1_MG-2023 TaxID=3062638 RepID=UPI0026E1C443|nr:VTT domain-containing protein [Gilvimarinus sp. 1_MG-2023]MDO6746806.1 VTT domain-containing protein [Gilvimarinus sp. 1_MG-2023]
MQILAKSLVVVSVAVFLAGLTFASSLAHWLLAMTAQASAFMQSAPIMFTLLFFISFVAITCTGLPGGAVFSILSGYFFGAGPGFVMCMLSTSLSAFCIWILVQHSGLQVPESIFAKQRLIVMKFIQQHAFGTILAIRLIPVIPFYLASLLLSYSGVRLSVYWGATILGLIPSALAFCWIGKGLHSAVVTETTSWQDLISSPLFYIPVLALCLMSLVATLLKRRLNA